MPYSAPCALARACCPDFSDPHSQLASLQVSVKRGSTVLVPWEDATGLGGVFSRALALTASLEPVKVGIKAVNKAGLAAEAWSTGAMQTTPYVSTATVTLSCPRGVGCSCDVRGHRHSFRRRRPDHHRGHRERRVLDRPRLHSRTWRCGLPVIRNYGEGQFQVRGWCATIVRRALCCGSPQQLFPCTVPLHVPRGFTDALTGVVRYEWAFGVPEPVAAGFVWVPDFHVDANGLGEVVATYPLQQGAEYFVTVRAYDAAGNFASATSDGVVVDSTAPSTGSASVQDTGTQAQHPLRALLRHRTGVTRHEAPSHLPRACPFSTWI